MCHQFGHRWLVVVMSINCGIRLSTYTNGTLTRVHPATVDVEPVQSARATTFTILSGWLLLTGVSGVYALPTVQLALHPRVVRARRGIAIPKNKAIRSGVKGHSKVRITGYGAYVAFRSVGAGTFDTSCGK